MKLWHAETVTGTAQDLEAALNRIEAVGDTIVGVTTFSGPYPSWTVVYYTHKKEDPSEKACER